MSKRLNPQFRKDRWKHGRKHGRAVCSRCRQSVQVGDWVTAAAGRFGAVRHAYHCPSGGGVG